MYFLAPLMVEFLSVRATNRLLQAVQADLAVPEFVAGCRALGLTGKVHHGSTLAPPCGRQCAVPRPVIPTYQGLASSLAAFAEDPTSLLDGTAVPFPGVKINRTSAILDKLLPIVTMQLQISSSCCACAFIAICTKRGHAIWREETTLPSPKPRRPVSRR